MKQDRLCHYINGKRYIALDNEPRHATLTEYKKCCRKAYGSLRGVTFGTVERDN